MSSTRERETAERADDGGWAAPGESARGHTYIHNSTSREMKKHPQRCKLSLVYGIWGYSSDQNTLGPKYSFKRKKFHLGVHIDIDHLLLHVVHSLQAYLVNRPLLSHFLGLNNQNLCIPFFPKQNIGCSNILSSFIRTEYHYPKSNHDLVRFH